MMHGQRNVKLRVFIIEQTHWSQMFVLTTLRHIICFFFTMNREEKIKKLGPLLSPFLAICFPGNRFSYLPRIYLLNWKHATFTTNFWRRQ